jgi:CRISPR-associated protein Cmr3
MKNIQLDPIDTLFFRNGRPFSMGEETWADAVFPPYPSVLYGALRTAYGLSLGADLTTIAIDTADIEIHDIYLALRNDIKDSISEDIDASAGAGVDPTSPSKNVNESTFERYYPMPLDLVVPYKQETALSVALEPHIKAYSSSSIPGTHLLLAPGHERFQSVDNGWIGMAALKRYLKGDTHDLPFKRLGDYMVDEPKVGIGRDKNTRTTEEGKLYRVGMVRASQCRIGIAFSKSSHETAVQSAAIRLGAEGKMAAWHNADAQDISAPKDILQADDCFRVWLATPAIFDKSNIPNLKAQLGVDATLLAGITGRTLAIGGWDMEKRSPKSMHQAMPAGSVWHFRANKPIDLSTLQGRSISTVGAEQGFGIAYFGLSNKNLYD